MATDPPLLLGGRNSFRLSKEAKAKLAQKEFDPVQTSDRFKRGTPPKKLAGKPSKLLQSLLTRKPS